jgi:hypothetical protein
MQAYERNPAGGWNDALLMELILPAQMERSGAQTPPYTPRP